MGSSKKGKFFDEMPSSGYYEFWLAEQRLLPTRHPKQLRIRRNFYDFLLLLKAGVHFCTKLFEVICNVNGSSKKEAISLVKIDVTVEKSSFTLLLFARNFFYDVIFSRGKNAVERYLSLVLRESGHWPTLAFRRNVSSKWGVRTFSWRT